MRPLFIDLYCGLGGWAEGILAEGADVVGFDIERHQYGDEKYPGHLVLQDVLTIDGRQFKGKAVAIVASPPCTEPSYRTMPWSRAKALNAIGPPHKFIELFNACFRIAREAELPIVVENVVGAQRWVGRAGWHFGSYYLWGDIPALMPITFRKKMPGFSLNPGPNKWGAHTTGGYENAMCKHTGIKQSGDWFNASEPYIARLTGSKSKARKRASAQIAKIPFPLASHIAKCFMPEDADA